VLVLALAIPAASALGPGDVLEQAGAAQAETFPPWGDRGVAGSREVDSRSDHGDQG
jgi:hypothetical protein